MRRLATVGAAVLAGAFALATAAADAQTTATTSGKLAPAEQQFLMQAAQSNAAEIAEGKLAEKQGASVTVRELGKRYADNHTANQQQLMHVASEVGGMLPSTIGPDAQSQAEMTRLEALHGEAFDRAFLTMEQTDHEKTIKKFKDEVATGKSAPVIAYAKKTLPVLDEHLLLATEDATRMNGAASTSKTTGSATNEGTAGSGAMNTGSPATGTTGTRR